MNLEMLRIPSDTAQIAQVEQYVKRVASSYHIADNRYADVLISLTEAVNNAIIHGNKENVQKEVVILLERRKDGLAFRVCDQGDGFNLKEVPDPTHHDILDCCGGRGVFIIKHLADNVDYHDNGSTVEMFFNCIED